MLLKRRCYKPPVAVATLLILGWPPAVGAQTSVCENAREVMQAVHYPPEAIQGGIEGKVLVEFTIAGDGSPSDVRIASSSSATFDEPVLQAIHRIRCDRSQAGRRVALPFTFSLSTEPGSAPASQGSPSLQGRPFRSPKRDDQLLYRRQLTSADGKGQNSLIRVRAAYGSDSYPIVFSLTDGRATPPGMTPIWRFGLRLPQGACLPDVLGNLWLKSQAACSSLMIGERWTADSVMGDGDCKAVDDETIEVPAGKLATRRIVCEWTKKDDALRRTTEYWYSTQAGYMVRVVRKTMDSSGTLQEMAVEQIEQLALK